MKLQLIFCLVLLSIPLSATPALNPPLPARTTTVLPDKYYRPEVYFGRSRPDGTIISDKEWDKFLNEVVTPRFPDGSTVLVGFANTRTEPEK